MKIVDISATVVSHMVEGSPVRFGIGAVRKHDFVLVRVQTDEGLIGYGESHHALAPTAVAELISTSLKDLLVGQDPLATEDLVARVWRAQLQSHGLGTGVAIAYSGIDMALWDIRGKAFGVPISTLLGATAKSFPAYAGGLALGFQEPSALVDEVESHMARHQYSGVKLRIGDNPVDDIRRVRAVREAVGPSLDIMVDVNTVYDLPTMTSLIPALEECNIAWLEEPLHPDATRLLQSLRGRTHVPIAIGENHLTLSAFQTLADLNCVDVFQADVSKAGGITQHKKIGDLATLYGLRFAPHCSHTPLNYAATLHVMSAVSSSWYFEAPVQSNTVVDSIFNSTIQVLDGRVRAPMGPGLGVEVDEDALASFAATPGAGYVR